MKPFLNTKMLYYLKYSFANANIKCFCQEENAREKYPLDRQVCYAHKFFSVVVNAIATAISIHSIHRVETDDAVNLILLNWQEIHKDSIS
jgi:hypothetical protein